MPHERSRKIRRRKGQRTFPMAEEKDIDYVGLQALREQKKIEAGYKADYGSMLSLAEANTVANLFCHLSLCMACIEKAKGK